MKLRQGVHGVLRNVLTPIEVTQKRVKLVVDGQNSEQFILFDSIEEQVAFATRIIGAIPAIDLKKEYVETLEKYIRMVKN